VTLSVYMDLTTSLPQPHNNFIEEDDTVLDEEQHFVGTSLGIDFLFRDIDFSRILIFGSGIKVTIFYFHSNPCDVTPHKTFATLSVNILI